MPRGRRGVLAAVALVSVVAGSAHALRGERLPLPSARQTIRDRIRAEQLLRAGRGPERTLPGPVTDTERVEVKVTPEGIPWRVVVDQRLEVHGVGDYFVKIPGPVRSVTGLADSTSEPGLRSGSLVWQGFATDGELLGARVVLDASNEQDRLPLAVTVRATLDGRPVDLDAKLSGVLELDVTVENTSGAEVVVPAGDPVDAVAAARALDRVAALLARDRRPDPGHRGIPRAIRVARATDETRTTVAAPLAVRLTVRFGGRGTPKPDRVERAGRLSGTRRTLEFDLARRVSDSRVRIGLEAEPSLPLPPEPPASAQSWEEGVRSKLVTGRAVIDRLTGVLAETARLPDVDAYLGNPDRDGQTATTYRFDVIAHEPVAGTAPTQPEPGQASFLAIAAVGLALVAAAAGLVVWWALS